MSRMILTSLKVVTPETANAIPMNGRRERTVRIMVTVESLLEGNSSDANPCFYTHFNASVFMPKHPIKSIP
jgi:hypothetical protein